MDEQLVVFLQKGRIIRLKVRINKIENSLYNCFSWYDKSSTLAFDIETTGFSKHSNFIYLIGYIVQERGEIYIKQLLADSRQEESNLLQQFFDDCRSSTSLLTFNGDQFDIPFIIARAKLHHLSTLFFENMSRFDLYKELKAYKKILPIPSARQKSFEEFLNTGRKDEMDGGELIQIYLDYEKKPTEQFENLLLLHNYEDVLGLLELQQLCVYEDALKSTSIEQSSYSYFEQTSEILITQKHSLDIPRTISFRNSFGYYSIEQFNRKLLLKIKKGFYKKPLTPHKDYVYLVSEDTIIPKALASTVDSSNIKKATSKNCFLRIESECIHLPATLEKELESFQLPLLIPLEDSFNKTKTIAISKESFFNASSSLPAIIADALFQSYIKKSTAR